MIFEIKVDSNNSMMVSGHTLHRVLYKSETTYIEDSSPQVIDFVFNHFRDINNKWIYYDDLSKKIVVVTNDTTEYYNAKENITVIDQ